MNISRRVVVSILFISIILLVEVLFGPFILNEIIRPISLVAWLFLRIFVLSIDQKYYWGAIIFAELLILFRILSQAQTTINAEESLDSNATIKNIGYWRSQFTLIDLDARHKRVLKQELIYLVVSLYASKQRTSPNFIFYDALQRGEIPLPDHIHSFLFSGEPEESRRSLKKLMQFVRETPRKWIRRWTGQESAEYYRMIDKVLCFMETTMEMKNDDGKFTPNKH